MKNFLVTSFAILISVPCIAEKGGISGAGDGGHGVVCRIPYDRTEGISYTVETLDLYEGRMNGQVHATKPYYRAIEPHQTIWVSSNIDKILTERQNQLLGLENSSTNIQLVSQVFQRARSLAQNLQAVDELPETHDLGKLNSELKADCAIGQMAFHQRDTNVVFVNRTFAEYSTDYDLAALIFHEALHSFFKTQKSTIAVRQVVVFTFGNLDFQKRNIQQFQQLLTNQQEIKFN